MDVHSFRFFELALLRNHFSAFHCIYPGSHQPSSGCPINFDNDQAKSMRYKFQIDIQLGSPNVDAYFAVRYIQEVYAIQHCLGYSFIWVFLFMHSRRIFVYVFAKLHTSIGNATSSSTSTSTSTKISTKPRAETW
jgi:hypothetical protein